MVHKVVDSLSLLETGPLPRAVRQPVISVVTICKDYESGFERTYESVAQQMDNAPKGSIEWIVVNGSTRSDTIKKMLDCAGDMVAWSQSKPDGGIYPAMNIGLDHVSGRFVNFMNAGDCFVEPDTLAKVNDVLAQNSDMDLAFGDYYFEDAYRSAVGIKINKDFLPSSHQAMFFNRQTIGEQRHDEKYRVAGDQDFYCQFLPKVKMAGRLNFAVARFEDGGVSSKGGFNVLREAVRVRQRAGGVTLDDFKTMAFCACGHLLRTYLPSMYEDVRRIYRAARGHDTGPPPPSAHRWTPVQL